MRKKTPMVLTSLVVLLLLVTAVVQAAPLAQSDSSGFHTDQTSMLNGELPNVTVEPLISVGDTLDSGYKFETLPDGVAVDPTGTNTFDVYVNHEASTVPFRNAADFTNALLSKLVMKNGNGKVLSGEYVIPSEANYLRFCSNFYAGAAEGFEFPLILTSEETSDFVNRTGDAWPPGAGAEQAGVVVAYNPANGEYRAIYGMGRHNHENSVALPGFGQAVVVSGDDTFSAPSSQLYMYIADNAQGVWDDTGHLFAFVADNPAINDYGDMAPGMNISGTFISVPDEIADGDQTGLENWSNANNVFQFIRVEDLAYDKNTPNAFYFADTGEPRAIPDATTGRLRRGPSGTQGPYPNGRIFKMVLDPSDATVVTGFSILVDGDAFGAASAGDVSLIHNPDNVETTPWSLMIQEDPGGQNSYPANDPNGTTARIWRYDLQTGELYVVASVNQAPYDPNVEQGNWESSGIVDASAMFGRGAFLVTVQAHSLLLDTNEIPNPFGGTILQKREGGQLLLLRVPGS